MAREDYPRSEAPKVCRRCQQTLPAAMFASNPRLRDGLHSYCRPCLHAYLVQWHHQHRGWNAGYQKRWRQIHPERFRAMRRAEYQRRKARQGAA